MSRNIQQLSDKDKRPETVVDTKVIQFLFLFLKNYDLSRYHFQDIVTRVDTPSIIVTLNSLLITHVPDHS
jgi:hypothetical protein